MDITLLHYFAVTAGEQHMGRAAEKLNISQPSLSAAIRRLEAELGYPLFDRAGRGIRLNEYGRIYLTGVNTALDSLSASLAEMETYKKNTTNLVKLSCSESGRNSALIDQLISHGVHLKVSGIPLDPEQALTSRQSDLVITMGVVRSNSLEYDELARHQLVFVVGNRHPYFHQRGPFSLSRLQHQLFCSTDSPNSLLNVLKIQKNLQDFHPTIAFYGRNSADMIKAIRTGSYIGIMVKKHLPEDNSIRILPVDLPDCTVPIYLYRRKERTTAETIQSVRKEIIRFYASSDPASADPGTSGQSPLASS